MKKNHKKTIRIDENAMTYTIAEIAGLTRAQFKGFDHSCRIRYLSIDSRKSGEDKASTLFFALIGQQHDGHHYIEHLYRQGVQNFVVSRVPDRPLKANFLVVKNTLDAFQKLVAFHRESLHPKIIAITGSNGKTIVKDWLFELLSPDYKSVKSPKSYNSQVGVPLSVWELHTHHDLGIFEAGISQTGEMERLEKILRPDIGVFTNIGNAHARGFSSIEEKIREKLKLFCHCELLIYKKDPRIHKEIMVDTACREKELLHWNYKDPTATLSVTDVQKYSDSTKIKALYRGDQQTLNIPFTDQAYIENAVICWLVMLYYGYSKKDIQQRMQRLHPIAMRLELKQAVNNCTLINDSYNSDLQSLAIALDFLEQQRQHQNKRVILSDIEQSGMDAAVLYQKVADLLTFNKIDRLTAIGKQLFEYRHLFTNASFYPDMQTFLTEIDRQTFQNETILLKGARRFHFEDISHLLEQKTHRTVWEINLDALVNNLNYFKSKLSPGVKLMVMIKAFAYGSGSHEVAKLLGFHKVDYFGVAFCDEGIALREAGIQTPIMVLNPEIGSYEKIIAYQLEPEIYSLRGLDAFAKELKTAGVYRYPVHIKLDTGMHRLGFTQKEIHDLCVRLKQYPQIWVASVFSHLAASDDLKEKKFTERQFSQFDMLSTEIDNVLSYKPMRHILNSAGISNYPYAQFDMVRLGIGLYGIGSTTADRRLLQNVGTLKSVISQIHTIEAGETVGYGRQFTAKVKSRIATIPIGYADGIPRAMGNGKTYVLIKNRKAPTVGVICMDMMMVDVSLIDCSEGDEVILFGENPSIEETASKLDTIVYELLTGISQRVKRVFYGA